MAAAIVEAAWAQPASPITNAASSFPTQGIASRYPGDAGIERDQRVVFVENFEEGSTAILWKRWETVSDRAGQSFSKDVPPGSSGKQSLLMEPEE